MCGIWAFIELIKRDKSFDISTLYKDFMAIKPRGPDMSSFQIIKNTAIGFHRLAIMDPTFHANQPYIMEDGDRTIIFICNGEIYNFRDLIREENLIVPNNSDCMTIPKLYIKYTKFNPFGRTDVYNFASLFRNQIKGEFAFVLFEFDRLQNLKQIVAGRDMIGVRPLYWHEASTQSTDLIFSSEIKGTLSYDSEIKEFPPGNIIDITIDSFGKICNVHNFKFETVYHKQFLTKENEYEIKRLSSSNQIENYHLNHIRESVINSVKRRLLSDRPIAFLLSGGVDSSLVAAISAKLLSQPINTFCCGMNEGTDLLYARQVAQHIGSNHKEVFFTPEEGIQAIRDVIYTIESYDTTSIRASAGQYLVCKHIGTKTDARVVMVGEGPDEVCSSYLFNYYAPSGYALDEAAKEYVKKIHMYDGRRADRCISRWGLEGRIAFLDPEFITSYWSVPAEWRMPTYKGIEKWWLRKAFDGMGILPDTVLWRKKEAFSDGVSSKEKSWFQIIQDFIDTQVSDEEFANNNKWNCPTKEAYFYKKTFVEFFGEKRLDIIPHYWQAKFTSDGKVIDFDNSFEYTDPSARTLKVYNE
jgi:asparagine synthase (glutamine-hydrolysing)